MDIINFARDGFFGFAPIYLNGVLALLLVLVLPGVVIA